MGVLDLGKGVKILNADEVRDKLQAYFGRRYGGVITRVEETGTGWRFIGTKTGVQPEGLGGGGGAGGEVDEEFLERIKGPIRNLAANKLYVFSQLMANRGLAPILAVAEGLVEERGKLLGSISCGVSAPELTDYEIEMGGMMANSIFVARLSAVCGAVGGTGIPVISGFRPLGMDVTTGLKDPDGINDSLDDFGHWSGNAADLKTRDWRLALGYRNLSDKGEIVADKEYTSFNELDYVADEYGLFRPFKHPKSDPTHWTRVEQTKWYREPDPSKKYTSGWSNSIWDRKCPKMR